MTCAGSDIAGLGNDDARALLVATYSGVVVCTNPGGNVVASHETTFDQSTNSGILRSKNGRVLVPQTSVTGQTELTQAQERAFCPNPSWDAALTDVQLESFLFRIFIVKRTGETVFFQRSS